jgi:hypothetical protein
MSRSDSDRRAGLRRSNGPDCCHLGLRGRSIATASARYGIRLGEERATVSVCEAIKAGLKAACVYAGQLLSPMQQLANVNASRARHLGGSRTRLRSCATFFRPRPPSPSLHRHVPIEHSPVYARHYAGKGLKRRNFMEGDVPALGNSRFNVSYEVARAMLAKRRVGK